MKLLLILLLFPLHLFSQDISGLWTGLVETMGNKLRYELVISENKDKTDGYSMTIFTIDGVQNAGMKSVIIRKKNGIISIEDKQLIYHDYSTTPKRVKLFADLVLTMEDSIMTLKGKFKTRIVHRSSPENEYYYGTIILQKQKNAEETRLLAQLEKMNLLNTLAFNRDLPVIASVRVEKMPPSLPEVKETVAKPISILSPVKAFETTAMVERKTEIIRNVFFSSDSLVLSIYDNGTIDGDTVSVLLNNKIILAKKALTGNAQSVVVYMSPDLGDSILLTMHAENLGSIPPNTGLLVIQDGNIRNEIRFEGNLQKNSGVVLRRKR